MEAIILAGGLGTRLAHVVKDVPKPMASVAGKPFLQYVVDNLIKQGIDRIILAVCHKKEVIVDYFGTEYSNSEILYSIETEPLLTGGAIKQALKFCKEKRVFIINGDTFFAVDLLALRKTAENMSKQVAIAVKELHNFSRYGQIEVDSDMSITAFNEKQLCKKGYINGGIYDFDRNALDSYPSRFSIENECFPSLLKTRQLIAFPSDGMFIDIGIPEDYERAQTIFGELK